jgi:hypothetical protein
VVEIAIGLLVLALFSPQPHVGLGIEQLHGFLSDPLFITFACVLAVTAVVFYIATRRRSEPRVLLTVLSAVLGSFSVMGAKAAIGLARRAVETHDALPFTHYATPYLLVAVAGTSAVMQVQYVNDFMPVPVLTCSSLRAAFSTRPCALEICIRHAAASGLCKNAHRRDR